MSNTFNVAVIGSGYWGPNLIRNFYQLPKVELSYICDLSNERLSHMASLYPDIAQTKDYKDILQDTNVDAVCIATPVSTHFKLAWEALEADKHVLLEKPMTATGEEARKLTELAEQKGKVLMVGHTFEYTAPINKLKEIIDSGELGKILYINMSWLNLGVFREDVNVVWDLAPHNISLLNMLLKEEPRTIKAIGSAHYHEGKEDVAFLNVSYPDNLIAHIHLSWIDPAKTRKLTVVGDKKMAIFDDLNDTEPIKIFDKSIIKQPYYESYGEFKLLYNWGDVYSPKIENTEPLKVQCSHFIDCIEKGKTPQSDGVSGMRVVEALEAAERSLKNNSEWVQL
ncbi:MAG: Gfo/Idh/MocA family oxidoreductase [Candidatus Spechtbacterales bacterium]|nr:Gfo/Idh/MocA family oxidoreductase [Candidatus Spechtbacterales bacterium]